MTEIPNFLIVGAAKCGTTSMSEYLKQHPQIFISEIKEPRFLSSQAHPFPLNGPGDAKRESRYIKKYADYQQLFQSANGHLAVGEASADTLYFYQKTIPVIKQYVGEQPKIIIMLRDPVKRAFSAYQHLIRDQRETASFEEGLRKEEERLQNNYELIWYYRGGSRYYESVKAFLESFDQVHIIINEDIRRDEKEVFRNVFTFLEVDPDFTVDTSIRYNASGVPHSKWLHNFLFEENWLKRSIRPITYRLTSQKFRQQTSNKMLISNLQRMEISSDIADMLKGEYLNEKTKLEELLGRKLPWLN
ncbi:MAG: sulfotransferase [Bacteroidota bacterium]